MLLTKKNCTEGQLASAFARSRQTIPDDTVCICATLSAKSKRHSRFRGRKSPQACRSLLAGPRRRWRVGRVRRFTEVFREITERSWTPVDGKMPSRVAAFVHLLLICFATNAAGMPQNTDENNGLFGLPFIQLKDGGIRVNFAGFHAQAGLGGLLDPSNAGGGLHASAGTPWGASAAAGLGGALGGNDGSAGGGLYARAGLGNGLPEARAGLGGMLSGSSDIPASGGLYAGATTGNRNSPSGGPDGNAGNNGGNDGNGAGNFGNAQASANAEAGTSKEKKPGGHTSIQVITRPRREEFEKSQISGEEQRKQQQQHDAQVRQLAQSYIPPLAAQASLYGQIDASGRPYITKSADSIKILSGKYELVDGIPHQAASVPVLDQDLNLIDPSTLPQRKHGRWSLRRRLRKKGAYKPVIIEQGTPIEVETVKRVTRDADDPPPSYEDVEREKGEERKSGDTFFDDVFNIPGSTLTAVNQLLKNHAG